MASSSGSLETTGTSRGASSFSFSSSQFSSSFSDLLKGIKENDKEERLQPLESSEQNSSSWSNFKSHPPPSLPLSPGPISPSSYFVSDFLESPLLHSSNILPSPRRSREREREMCPSSRRYGEEREEELRPAFKVLDVDGDGKIGREDLKSFFSSAAAAAPSKSSEPVIRSMIAAADANRDGYVAFDEFEGILHGGGGGGIMEDVFRKMDGDEDGELGFEDLRDYMNYAGLVVSDEDITAMISLASGRGGGGVCFRDFLKIIALDFA